MDLGTYQSSLRLRRLTSACDADGLLLVAGRDGNYNAGSSQAIAYLLLGNSNRDVAESCPLPKGLDDAVLLLRNGGVAAYVPDQQTANLLRDLLAETTSDIQIFQPTAEEQLDPDLFEEHKIGSFVQMLSGLKTLAIPWAADGRPADAMQLERWPLMLAYGLEGVGKAGFFTQNFKAVDVYSLLQDKVYGQLDGHAAELAVAVGAGVLQQVREVSRM